MRIIKSIARAVLILGVGLVACTKQSNTNSTTQQTNSTETQITNNMKNLVSIVEIPTEDFYRAVAFYQVILGIKIEEVEMDGIKMGLFPTPVEGIFVQLVNGTGYKPSNDGTLVYLNGGDDLQNVADKIEPNGGTIILPKTEIGPEMGFFAMFMDTEGNKLGLHSYK